MDGAIKQLESWVTQTENKHTGHAVMKPKA